MLDRSIYEDSLLFHLNADLGRATEIEVEVYDALLENMLEEINTLTFKKRPDLLIHVSVSFEKMLERIQKEDANLNNWNTIVHCMAIIKN